MTGVGHIEQSEPDECICTVHCTGPDEMLEGRILFTVAEEAIMVTMSVESKAERKVDRKAQKKR
jgi:hypothetical protein